MNSTRSTCSFVATILAVAAALALVGPAAASPRPDDRAGELGAGAALAEQARTPVRPDDRADRRISPAGRASAATATLSSSDDFGWADVAGLSFLLGAVGLGIASVVLVRRRTQHA